MRSMQGRHSPDDEKPNGSCKSCHQLGCFLNIEICLNFALCSIGRHDGDGSAAINRSCGDNRAWPFPRRDGATGSATGFPNRRWGRLGSRSSQPRRRDDGAGHRTSPRPTGSTCRCVSPLLERLIARTFVSHRCKIVKPAWRAGLRFAPRAVILCPTKVEPSRCAHFAPYILTDVGHRRSGPGRCWHSRTKARLLGRLPLTSLSHDGVSRRHDPSRGALAEPAEPPPSCRRRVDPTALVPA